MLKYFRDRVDSKKSVEAHSYLLLNEGQHSSPHHAWLMAALGRHGLGRIGSTVNLVPPPSSARRAPVATDCCQCLSSRLPPMTIWGRSSTRALLWPTPRATRTFLTAVLTAVLRVLVPNTP